MAGRRYTSRIPRLTGRAWEDVARELEEFLRRTADSSNSGIPPGFGGPGGVGSGSSQSGNGVQDVFADATPSAGTENMGWAAVDHQHNALTAAAVALIPSSINEEGTGEPLARADHSHDVSALVADALVWAIIFGGD